MDRSTIDEDWLSAQTGDESVALFLINFSMLSRYLFVYDAYVTCFVPVRIRDSVKIGCLGRILVMLENVKLTNLPAN